MAETEGAKFEMKAHEQTYGGFVSLLKISTIITAIATAVVVYLIAS